MTPDPTSFTMHSSEKAAMAFQVSKTSDQEFQKSIPS